MSTKPKQTKEISQEELDELEVIEQQELVDGYKSDDLQQYINF